MQNSQELVPPVQYGRIWLIVGLLLAAIVCGVNGYILWSTRKKRIRSIQHLPVLKPVVVSIDALRQKYFTLITEIEVQYTKGEIDVRQVHLLLSTTARLFVFEAKGVSVHKLTLTEIRKLDLQALSDVIAEYYPPEFSKLEAGEAAKAIALARRMVQQWS